MQIWVAALKPFSVITFLYNILFLEMKLYAATVFLVLLYHYRIKLEGCKVTAPNITLYSCTPNVLLFPRHVKIDEYTELCLSSLT